MERFRFELEQGSRKYQCPACRKHRFVRYVDTENGEHIADEVGRCDREDSCGYHLKPGDYFRQQGKRSSPIGNQSMKKQSMVEQELSLIEPKILDASMARHDRNYFCRWLCTIFGESRAFQLTNRFWIGTSKHWMGACVFWQIDESWNIRGGKIMLYDTMTGKRVKHPFCHIQWVHSVLNIPNYNLQQCLFGEHQLSSDDNMPIAIVESEKTAIVASGFMPEFIWLATAGKGNLSIEKLTPVQGRKVVLFPDLGAFDKWQTVVNGFAWIRVSDILERYATEENRKAGLDLADYLLLEHSGSLAS